MVLLWVLHELSRAHCWKLTLAHLNHRLRGRSSDMDEQLVRRTAAKLKLRLLVKRVDVRVFARTHKLSLEMAARNVRHGFLADAAAQSGIPTIALAHHADDQLELFLLRLLRGSGGEGLAGMNWSNPSPADPAISLVRPLLDQPKSVLRYYASSKKIPFREDASNASVDILRNRIRHELLPLLRKKYQPALDKTFLRVMNIIGAESEFVVQVGREWLWEKGVRGGSLATDAENRKRAVGSTRRPWGASAFESLPVAVQRCCVRLQLMRQGIEADYGLIEQLRIAANKQVAIGPAKPVPIQPKDLASVTSAGLANQGRRVRGVGDRPVPVSGKTLAGRWVVRDPEGLVHLQHLAPLEFMKCVRELNLRARQKAVIFDGVRVCWREGAAIPAGRIKPVSGREVFDADKIGSTVLLRHWQPGDRFQPIGMVAPVKLQDLFTNLKIPPDRRRELVLAATADGVLFWVEGLRISDRFKLTKKTIRRLQWTWQRL